MIIALGIVTYIALNLYITCLAAIVDPLGIRQVFGYRQSRRSAALWALLAALVAGPMLVWTLYRKSRMA